MRQFQRLPIGAAAGLLRLSLLVLVKTTPVAAQIPGGIAHGVATVSSDTVDATRISELLGLTRTEGLMLRSTSSLMDPRRLGQQPRAFTIVFPSLTFVSNSDLPFGQNNGALWEGKGANLRMLAGVTGTFGPVRVILLPELAYSSNNRLPIDPADTRFWPAVPEGRSHFSSPANVFPYSIDMPWRMGETAPTKIRPGQSSITLTAAGIEGGVSSENEWWGPAIRNALVMSDNAPGFPHAFVRSTNPFNTILGRLDVRWILGALSESEYFDDDPSNDYRSLSAIGLTWKRNASSGLTLGFTRSVFSAIDGRGDVAGHLFDFITGVGHPNARAVTDSTMEPGKDQLFSLFARWVVPRFGLESYAEWGRADFPVSLRDLLEQPDHSRGYTAGIQWAREFGSAGRVRIQGEVTNVEQSSTFRFRPLGSWYTSRAVIQGYTNEGQVIGAGIGPGSSSQWIATDLYQGPWSIGLTLGRTRFNNDAFFLLPYANRCGHDVTVYPGIRGGYANRYVRLRAEYASAQRYNTFFQNKSSCESDGEGSDRSNRHLTLTLSTLGW